MNNMNKAIEIQQTCLVPVRAAGKKRSGKKRKKIKLRLSQGWCQARNGSGRATLTRPVPIPSPSLYCIHTRDIYVLIIQKIINPPLYAIEK